MKERKLNKQEADKEIGKKYVGTLKSDSMIRGWKGESTKKSVAIRDDNRLVNTRLFNQLFIYFT